MAKQILEYIDPNLNYRKDDILPEVWEQLQAAREKGGYPSQAFIDNLISWQNEKSPEMAIRYVGYKYLGTYSYMEVYGPAGDTFYHNQLTDRIIKTLDDQQEQISGLQMQISQMQRLIVNMAKTMNDSHLIRRTG